ncbi:hypothetical protein [Dactylosporangium roseum]|nr:hypothetical protein [Dactylosporangium roseum]
MITFLPAPRHPMARQLLTNVLNRLTALAWQLFGFGRHPAS